MQKSLTAFPAGGRWSVLGGRGRVDHPGGVTCSGAPPPRRWARTSGPRPAGGWVLDLDLVLDKVGAVDHDHVHDHDYDYDIRKHL